MPTRMAAITALFAFSVCLVIGTFQANNPFDTTVLRALTAMAVCFGVGFAVGVMAQRMIEESVSSSLDLSSGRENGTVLGESRKNHGTQDR
ncbi:MAG: hypothetical protein ACFCVE_07875 [Phycisphaerae bacterium]